MGSITGLTAIILKPPYRYITKIVSVCKPPPVNIPANSFFQIPFVDNSAMTLFSYLR